MPIGPSISITEHGVFEPEVIALMGEAVDAACGELPISDQSDDVRELIAMLIIAAAFRGEIDPIRLRTFALSELSSLSEMSPPAGRDGRLMRLNERPRSERRSRSAQPSEVASSSSSISIVFSS
jgi:hypothetical protein